MTDSAGARELRRVETTKRIMRCALELTDAYGLDGWTMDGLADEAGVSRRTLFNYYTGKVDAVLGAIPRIETVEPELIEAVETFKHGGPHGRLVDDIAELARIRLASKDFDAEVVRMRRRVLAGSPRLIEAAHEHFENTADSIVRLILDREGPAFGVERAQLTARVLVAVFDAAMRTYLANSGKRGVDELFAEYLHATGEILS